MLKDKIKMIVDENGFSIRPDPEWIKEKKWFCRIYLFGYDRIEANFITDAIVAIENKAIEFIVDEKIVIVGKQEINVNYVDNFYSIDRNIDIGVSHAGFTNMACDYLYWKDAENEIFMLFGSEEFTQQAMPIDKKEYQVYYEGFYEDWLSKKNKSFLKRLWEDYPTA